MVLVSRGEEAWKCRRKRERNECGIATRGASGDREASDDVIRALQPVNTIIAQIMRTTLARPA